MNIAYQLLMSASLLLGQLSNPNLPQSFKDTAYAVANQAIIYAQSYLADIPAGQGQSVYAGQDPADTQASAPAQAPQTAQYSYPRGNYVPNTVPVAPAAKITSRPVITVVSQIPATYLDANDDGVPDCFIGCINNPPQTTYDVHFETNVPTTAHASISDGLNQLIDYDKDFDASTTFDYQFTNQWLHPVFYTIYVDNLGTIVSNGNTTPGNSPLTKDGQKALVSN